MFQVALFQLAEVTLMVSVYNKRSMKKKEMIGWFSLGLFNYILINGTTAERCFTATMI